MNPDDRTTIQSAYQEAVKKLYATLFDAYLTAGGGADLKKAADDHFSAGLTVARTSRDRALALVAEGA
jgi:hypothetical protein